MRTALNGTDPARRPRFEVIRHALLDERTTSGTQTRLAEHGITLSPRQIERDIAAVKHLLRTALARPRMKAG